MCVIVKEFHDKCCHLTVQTLRCGSPATCPGGGTHVFTDYIKDDECVFCTTTFRTRSARAKFQIENDLIFDPDKMNIPEEERVELRLKWQGLTNTFRKQRRLREDIMTPIAVEDIDKDHLTCIHCWRQFDGVGDDCCEKPRKLHCGHIFGQRCILEWMFTSGKHWCPSCRKGFERPSEARERKKRHGLLIENIAELMALGSSDLIPSISSENSIPTDPIWGTQIATIPIPDGWTPLGVPHINQADQVEQGEEAGQAGEITGEE